MLGLGARRWRPAAMVVAALAALFVMSQAPEAPALAADGGDTLQAAALPSDPLYVQRRQWYLDRVQAPQAWGLLPPGGNTIVAVLDTGVDVDHPDLVNRVSDKGCDAFRKQCARGPSRLQVDAYGHGTFVAGIIGAETNNGQGIASVSGGRATILPIQISSMAGRAATDTIAESIIYAVDHGARVINISFGGGCGAQQSPTERRAIDYAESKDVLIVMSAGNSGGCYQGRYPQNDPRVMNVGATNIADDFAPFTDRGQYVTVAAPGVDIVSTLPWGYGQASGTSFSAPIVAAQAALLFQVPGATKAKVVEWITSTCDPANVSARCGGRVNVYRSVHLAVKGTDPAKTPAQPTDTPVSPGASPASTTPTPEPTPPGTTVPAGRLVPPALPAGFLPSERALTAVLPALPATLPADLAWTGVFWPSAPVLNLGLCGVVDGDLLAAVDGAMRTWNALVARGLAWQVERPEGMCDGSFSGAKVVVFRGGGDDGSDPVSLSVVDMAGNTCGTGSCWAGMAILTINADAFDTLDDAGRAAAILRELVRASGITPPAGDLSDDDIIAMNALLSVTLLALRQ